MIKLLQYLDSIYPLSGDLRQHLQEIIKRKELSRKEHLIREGQTCREFYFIEKGLLRCYYITGGIEISARFSKEDQICTAVESFFNQEPSTENIQAIEKTAVLYIRYDDLQTLYREFPEFNLHIRLWVEQEYIFSEHKLSAIRLRRSHERYAWLRDNFPELVLRVPSKFLASYLGVTEVTLSVVKKY